MFISPIARPLDLLARRRFGVAAPGMENTSIETAMVWGASSKKWAAS